MQTVHRSYGPIFPIRALSDLRIRGPNEEPTQGFFSHHPFPTLITTPSTNPTTTSPPYPRCVLSCPRSPLTRSLRLWYPSPGQAAPSLRASANRTFRFICHVSLFLFVYVCVVVFFSCLLIRACLRRVGFDESTAGRRKWKRKYIALLRASFKKLSLTHVMYGNVGACPAHVLRLVFSGTVGSAGRNSRAIGKRAAKTDRCSKDGKMSKLKHPTRPERRALIKIPGSASSRSTIRHCQGSCTLRILWYISYVA